VDDPVVNPAITTYATSNTLSLMAVIKMSGVSVTKHSKIMLTSIIILLASLSVSVGLNIYLFAEVSKGGEGVGEASRPIRGHFSDMWDAFSIRIAPDRAVLSLRQDERFNISVTALRWAPYASEPRTFYFKIYDEHSEPPRLLDEKNVTVDKSKDDLDYAILFDFTVNLDVRGTLVYTIVGGISPSNPDCEVSFAMNIGE
jgi:hypothetical protein